jgi:hypothetical protein
MDDSTSSGCQTEHLQEPGRSDGRADHCYHRPSPRFGANGRLNFVLKDGEIVEQVASRTPESNGIYRQLMICNFRSKRSHTCHSVLVDEEIAVMAMLMKKANRIADGAGAGHARGVYRVR